jgi:hypothetical protein
MWMFLIWVLPQLQFSKRVQFLSPCQVRLLSGVCVDTISVWLTTEIAHFAVSKYFSCSYASWSSPEHLCSLALTCALPCSLVLCCAHSCSAMLTRALPCSLVLCCTLLCSAAHLQAAFPHFAPYPLASPIHLIPLSFLVTTYTLVPGPLGHLVYKPCNYTLLP